MVQWPVLWTRGAISLTSSAPSLPTNNSTAKHADIVQRIGDLLGDGLGLGAPAPRSAATARWSGAGYGFRAILRRIEGRESAIGAARRDHRRLEGEIDKAFQDGRRALNFAKARGALVGAGDFRLALAVIAEAAGLQDAAAADLGESRARLRRRCDTSKNGAVFSPSFSTKVFSLSRSWVMASALAPGPHRHQRLPDARWHGRAGSRTRRSPHRRAARKPPARPGRHRARPPQRSVTWKAGASGVVVIDAGLQPQPRGRHAPACGPTGRRR